MGSVSDDVKLGFWTWPPGSAQRTERRPQNQVLKTINTCKSLRGERQTRKLSQSSQEGRRKIHRDEQESAGGRPCWMLEGGLIGWEVETKVSLQWTEGKITGEEGRQKMSHIHQESCSAEGARDRESKGSPRVTGSGQESMVTFWSTSLPGGMKAWRQILTLLQLAVGP